MRRSISEKRATFRTLHEHGCFVIPSPWDAGSARYLQGLGFSALATSRAGFAWSQNNVDNGDFRQDMLAHVREIDAATDLPVNADIGNEYGADAMILASGVQQMIANGVAGVSIKDATGNASDPLFSLEVAKNRVRTARISIDAMGGDAFLTARADNFISGRHDLVDTVARLIAYAKAGADCLYAPGLTTRDQIATVVAAVAPKPVNLLVDAQSLLTLEEIVELGVRRVSVGSALARSAWGGFMRAAQSLAQGRFDGLSNAVSFDQLNAFFRITRDAPLVKQPAHIIAQVDYRAGDGPLRTIPRGIVEVETSAMDAVLTWKDGQAHAVAAMPVANFCQYVADGAIIVENNPPLGN